MSIEIETNYPFFCLIIFLMLENTFVKVILYFGQ